MKWIKVTNQFMNESDKNCPKYYEHILFYVPENDLICIGKYTEDFGFICDEMGDYYNLQVSHWMPLPLWPDIMKENNG